jgi:hypothetical protein
VPERGAIDGFVWNDLDGDGDAEAGEPGIFGVTVRLLLNGAHVGGGVSSGDGSFRFDGLYPAHYTVEEANLIGLYSSTPDLVEVDVLPGQRTQVRFGDWEGRRSWVPLLLQ